MWLQKLTTKVPDEAQIEVAISSLIVALDDETFSEVAERGLLPAAATAARSQVIEVSKDLDS
jgi:hypothetical protein